MVGVVSARGGLGATTLALNLGISLREAFKKDVIVAEFRPGQGTISLDLGYQKPEGLNHLLAKKPNEVSVSDIENELTTHASGMQLLLASNQPRDGQLQTAVANFEAIAHQLPYMARYVILDLGPSITPITDKVVKFCDEVIVVVEPVPQTILQTKALIHDLISGGVGEKKITLVLVNRIRSGVQLSWSQVQEKIGHNITVIFTPAPELAYQASEQRLPIVLMQPDSLTAQQFSKLAERIAQSSR